MRQKGLRRKRQGPLTGDKDLKKEGKADRAASSVKDKVDSASDKLTGKD